MINENNQLNFHNPSVLSLISVIVPVYKDFNGLRSTLISLDKQTFDKSKYQIIVVNDGDDSQIKDVCKEFSVEIINTHKRFGSYYARNKGIENSSGEYLAFIDAGTIAGPQWLKQGFQLIKKYDYVGGKVNVVKSDLNALHSLFVFEKHREFATKELMEDLHFSPTTNLFVKRKVLQQLGGFDFRLRSSGDYEFGDRVYMSDLYTQFYSPDLIVYHPARDFKSLIKKQVRLALGFIDLGKLYPNRFKGISNSFLINLLKLILPPFWLFKKDLWLKLSFYEKISVFSWTYFCSFTQRLVTIRHAQTL